MSNRIQSGRIYNVYGIFGKDTLIDWKGSKLKFQKYVKTKKPVNDSDKIVMHTFYSMESVDAYISGIKDSLTEEQFNKEKLVLIETVGSNLSDNDTSPTADLWYDFMREYINESKNSEDIIEEERLYMFLDGYKDDEELESKSRTEIADRCLELGIKLFSKALSNYYDSKFFDFELKR